MITQGGLLPKVPTVDPGGAVPPDAPHQPQTVRLYTAQVTRDLPPEPAARIQRKHPALAALSLADKKEEVLLSPGWAEG